jgi:hypothetical protein
MIFIPRTLQVDVEAQNHLNHILNQVQKDLCTLILPFVGKKIIKITPYRRLTKQFEGAIKSILDQSDKRKIIIIDCSSNCFVSVRVKINYPIPNSEGVKYKDGYFYLGDLENGIILKNVNEPIVRFTNISHEEVLNDFKELQRLEEEMDKVRNRIRDFI